MTNKQNLKIGDWVEVMVDLTEMERTYEEFFITPHQYFSKISKINGSFFFLENISATFPFVEEEIKKVEL